MARPRAIAAAWRSASRFSSRESVSVVSGIVKKGGRNKFASLIRLKIADVSIAPLARAAAASKFFQRRAGNKLKKSRGRRHPLLLFVRERTLKSHRSRCSAGREPIANGQARTRRFSLTLVASLP